MSGKIAKIGDKIRIIHMEDSYLLNNEYDGKEGYVTGIDDMGLLHGTWGSFAVIPEEDEFIVL